MKSTGTMALERARNQARESGANKRVPINKSAYRVSAEKVMKRDAELLRRLAR